ncbi:MAG TPA: DUF2339 domain-containing protein, partial [Pseudonocardiaceae bacterium]
VALFALVLPGLRLPGAVRAVAAVAGSVAVFEATLVALRGGTGTAVLLGEALALAIAAIVLRRRFPLAIGAAFGVVGAFLVGLRDAPVGALLTFPSRPYLVNGAADTTALITGVAVSALLLAVAVAVLVAAHRTGLTLDRAEAGPLWVAAAFAVLYAGTGVLVTAALLATATRTGFLTGHVLVTVSWTVAALVLLVRGIRLPALRVVGGVLVVAAVAKLVLFDLSQLDGLARVLAFLGAGLVLLAAGTRYARLVSAARAPVAQGQPQGQPQGPHPGGPYSPGRPPYPQGPPQQWPGQDTPTPPSGMPPVTVDTTAVTPPDGIPAPPDTTQVVTAPPDTPGDTTQVVDRPTESRPEPRAAERPETSEDPGGDPAPRSPREATDDGDDGRPPA